MILASGFRYPGRKAGIDDTRNKFKRIIKELLENIRNSTDTVNIDIDEAIDDKIRKQNVSSVRPSFDILPQLQENFAFSRAYIADKSGSAGNLPGRKFYVDLNIFKYPEEFEPYVKWSCNQLKISIDFAKFTTNDTTNGQDVPTIEINSEKMNNKTEITERLERKSELFSATSRPGIRPVFL